LLAGMGKTMSQRALHELGPQIVRIAEEREAVEVARDEVRRHIGEKDRTAHGDHLLLEQEVRNEPGAEGRLSLTHGDVDTVGLEVRQILRCQYPQFDVGMVLCE